VLEEPAPVSAVRSAPVRRIRANLAPATKIEVTSAEASVEVHRESPPAAKPAPRRPWPVRELDGASGRLVRVGTFSTVRQAKKGWWAIVRMNPALKRLPALVVPVQSQRNGRVYYRLQMGTTSQAHSAVLCQRMRMIGQGCVVIGQNPAGQEIAL
jgi:mRNA-degrading endonuclease toxin of MazEF toxin-antitoxin module